MSRGQRKAVAASRRRYALRTRYGISPEEYEAMLIAQGGVCAACGGDRRYNLHVDHDHAIERARCVRAAVRGLLCKRCNALLRDCRDDPTVLDRLAAYLREPPAHSVLKGEPCEA